MKPLSLHDPASLPAEPGLYILELVLRQASSLFIGALGEVHFPAGYYGYVGSACGPGGLRGRILRHLRKDGKRLHWHIDYLVDNGDLTGVFWTIETQMNECELAEWFAEVGERFPPHFGASDCRCPGHLIHLPRPPAPISLPPGLQHLSLCNTGKQ